MPKIGANFDLVSKQPNFSRDQFETLALMKACNVCDDGHIAYCVADGKRYEFKNANSIDSITGKWRELNLGGGASEADNYIGDTDSDKVIRVDTDKQSVAEGFNTTASGALSHTEGIATKASSTASHAEGQSTTASGSFSHAEGMSTQALKDMSHAEGNTTKADGYQSHAEGIGTNANGNQSHAEGGYTQANGDNSHAEGSYTVTSNYAEHAEGSYNNSHTHASDSSGQTIHSVGIGTSNSNRKNAHEIMMNGDHYFGDGKLYLGDFGNAKGRLDAAESTIQVTLNGLIIRRFIEGYSDTFEYDSRIIEGIAGSVAYAYRFGLANTDNATEVVPKYENSFIGREVTVNGITYIVPIEGSRKDVSCDLSPYIKGSDDQFYYVIPGTVISSATVSLGILSSIPVLLNNLLPKVNVAYKDRWVTYTYYTGDDNLRIDVPSDYNCIYDLRQKTGGTITIDMSNAGRNYKETVIYLNDAYGYSIEGDDYIEVNEPPSDENSGVIISIQNNIIVYGGLPVQE